MPDEEMQYFSIVTDLGTEKLVQATHDGKKVNITHYVLGDGNGQFVTPSGEMTELVNECYKGEIYGYEISDNDPKQLIIRCIVPSEVGYFKMREWGLLDEEGDLIVVANTADTPLVPAQTGQIFNLYLNIYVQFDNLEFDSINIIVHNATEELILEEARELVNSLLNRFDARIKALEAFKDAFESTLESKLTPIYIRLEELEAFKDDLEPRVIALEETLDGVEEFFEEEI